MSDNLESSIPHGWYKWNIWSNILKKNNLSILFNDNFQKERTWEENA